MTLQLLFSPAGVGLGLPGTVPNPAGRECRGREVGRCYPPIRPQFIIVALLPNLVRVLLRRSSTWNNQQPPFIPIPPPHYRVHVMNQESAVLSAALLTLRLFFKNECPSSSLGLSRTSAKQLPVSGGSLCGVPVVFFMFSHE